MVFNYDKAHSPNLREVAEEVEVLSGIQTARLERSRRVQRDLDNAFVRGLLPGVIEALRTPAGRATLATLVVVGLGKVFGAVDVVHAAGGVEGASTLDMGGQLLHIGEVDNGHVAQADVAIGQVHPELGIAASGDVAAYRDGFQSLLVLDEPDKDGKSVIWVNDKPGDGQLFGEGGFALELAREGFVSDQISVEDLPGGGTRYSITLLSPDDLKTLRLMVMPSGQRVSMRSWNMLEQLFGDYDNFRAGPVLVDMIPEGEGMRLRVHGFDASKPVVVMDTLLESMPVMDESPGSGAKVAITVLANSHVPGEGAMLVQLPAVSIETLEAVGISDAGEVVYWQDDKGVWYAGIKDGDKQLVLGGDGTWAIPEAAIDPLAWQEFGANSEIIATGADLTLWDGTPQEQRFTLNPDHAEELHAGLLEFVAMENWHGNQSVRDQYGTFTAYLQYLEAHPQQSNLLMLVVNPDMGNKNGGQQAVWVEAGVPIDLSQIAVAFEDADGTPRGEGWVNMLGGIAFKMQVVQNQAGENVIQIAIANWVDFDRPDYSGKALNPDKSNQDNADALRQAINFLINRGGRMATASRDSVVMPNDNNGNTWKLNFSAFELTKSDMDRALNGTSFVEVGE